MLERFRALPLKHKIAWIAGAAIALPAFFLLTLFLLVRLEVVDKLPSSAEIASIQNPNATALYAADGQLIGKYYVENRTDLEWDQLNDFYKHALIATEDVRFYKHNGVDLRSLGRVAIKTVLLQQSTGGGSTLTQQLAKNVFKRRNYRVFGMLINKFREMCIARRLEAAYEKDDILLMYTNTVSFGELAFGLATASERFFNKAPEDLLLEEAATLVGMLKAPTYYSPRNHPERARERRNVVLRQMARYDYITPAVAAELSELPLEIDYQPPTRTGEQARYFKRYVSKEFEHWSKGTSKADGSKYNLYRDGLKIYTSLDLDLQKEAERQMERHMQKLQRIFEESWQGGRMFGPDTRIIDDGIRADPLYQRLKKEGKNKQELLDAFTSPASRFFWTWDGGEERRTTKIDSIKHYLSLLHAGILAVDPGTGEIRTWVGGNDYGRFQWDNVIAPRQVGSLFKPIVYLAALEQGIGPCDYYENERQVYEDWKDWSPQNSDGEYGGHMPVAAALAHSVNTISVQILFEAGLPAVMDMAQRLGIRSPLAKVPSIVLGTSDISLYEMVRAYSVFANDGYQRELYTIRRIEDHAGNVLYEAPALEATERVIDPEHIATLNAMLSKVTSEGTGSRLRQNYDIPFAIMGKTGTTQNQSDGLFIGYTDGLLIGAWVGAMDRRIHFRNLGTGSGGRTALPLVGALFEFAADQGYRPRNRTVTIDFDCPTHLPDEDYALLEILRIEDLIDALQDSRRDDLKDARRERSRISKRDNRDAWEDADARHDSIKDVTREQLEELYRQLKQWRRVVKELERKVGERI